MYKNKKAFTLVELIVVITILAILWTIAFISLQWYSKQARDSKRISDINNIKKSLELFSLNTWYYPEPDGAWTMHYSWELLFTQWTIWDTVTTNLSINLNEKPLDPLFDIEYIYSRTASKKEYEVMSIREWELASTNLLNNSFAANKYTPKIEWTYNEVFVKTPSFIVPLPSIITSEDLSLWLTLDWTNIDSLVINDWENFPDLGIPNIEVNTWWLDIKLSVYTWSITNNSSDDDKIDVITAIQEAYSWTTLKNNSIYSDILNSSDLVTLAEQLVLSKSSSSQNTNTFNFTFDSANNWIQENNFNWTTLNNDIKLYYNTNGTVTPSYFVNTTALSAPITSSSLIFLYKKYITPIYLSSGKYYWEIQYDWWTSASYWPLYMGIENNSSQQWYESDNLLNWHVRYWFALDINNWTLDTFKDWVLANSYTNITGSIRPFLYNTASAWAYRYQEFFDWLDFTHSENKPEWFISWFGLSSQWYTTSQPYYITTSGTNQLDLSILSIINSINITHSKPTNTSIKALVSFDWRTTWEKWNWTNWIPHVWWLWDLENWNTISDIEIWFTNFTITSESSLDFAFDFNTTDSSVSPSISWININY